MIEAALILALIGLLVVQQVMHSRNEQKLLDKLMSRNYHEYQVSKQVSEPKAPHSEISRITLDDGQLDELNRLTSGVGPL